MENLELLGAMGKHGFVEVEDQLGLVGSRVDLLLHVLVPRRYLSFSCALGHPGVHFPRLTKAEVGELLFEPPSRRS